MLWAWIVPLATIARPVVPRTVVGGLPCMNIAETTGTVPPRVPVTPKAPDAFSG